MESRIGIIRIIFIVGCFIIFGLCYAVQAPYLFPKDTLITVTPGESFSEIAQDFKDQHIIHSTLLFRAVAFMKGAEHSIVAGVYDINTPLSLFELTARLKAGSLHVRSMKVTIPEGSTVKQIGDILQSIFPVFDRDTFVTEATPKEGYLFPDTYLFFPIVRPQQVISVMSDTFNDKIATYTQAIAESKHSLSDIIIMASILEKEARTVKDFGIISGILWKRMALGMPLQVDATSNYYLGKTSASLTTQDLRDKSPYNTYTHKGLPPTPIANPGIETIEAALNPVKTPYFYYLSDAKNVIHYARTYEEHLRNRVVYLGK
jgi:UPF0755 protein